MRLKKILIFFAGALFLLALFGINKTRLTQAKTVEEIQKEIESYQREADKLSAQSKTLANQIAQFDAQIKLTNLKIGQTEEKILLLGGRIDQLEGSLDALTQAFSSRAVETYKMNRLADGVFLLVSSEDLSEIISRYHYLQEIQKSDQDLLQRLQTAQTIYQGEKQDEEELQVELEKQKENLAKQKQEKNNLLAITKNDEKRYQQLLANSRAELAVVLGQGKETFLRQVSEGDTIGKVIPTASGCSSGEHLHFEIHNGSSILNPNDYLRPISFSYSYNSDQYGYYGTINPHGGWRWPMDEPIHINQGFGSHGYAKAFYAGGLHAGIDLDSPDSNSVKAVKAGKLYAGAYTCGGAYPGTLTYSKVDHGDGVTTWYLHINPQ